MSAAAAKQLVHRFYAGVFEDPSLVESCVDAEYVDHNHQAGLRGPAVVRAHVEAVLQTFPDFRLEIVDMIAEGDRVVTRVAGKGTHLGNWMGIEPKGAIVQVRGINIDRVADTRIVEHWGEADTVGMLIQMGVDPFVGRSEGV